MEGIDYQTICPHCLHPFGMFLINSLPPRSMACELCNRQIEQVAWNPPVPIPLTDEEDEHTPEKDLNDGTTLD